jgi:hypothetical protein
MAFRRAWHIWRLLAMTLVRYDVLLPGEYYERYPVPLQATHTLLRIVAKRRRGRSVGERLARALERLGPAYVKVGQFLATRPDMIGVNRRARTRPPEGSPAALLAHRRARHDQFRTRRHRRIVRRHFRSDGRRLDRTSAPSHRAAPRRGRDQSAAPAH